MAKKNIIPTNCFFADGGEDYELADITVASTAEEQVIIAADGVAYDKITVVPVQGQEKTVDPTEQEQEIVPDAGRVLSKVTVSAVQTETKTVAPAQTVQTVVPSEGRFLSKVTVQSAALRDGLPIEISSASDLAAALSDASNAGKIYKYTGTTTSDYTSGELYICYDDNEVIL